MCVAASRLFPDDMFVDKVWAVGFQLPDPFILKDGSRHHKSLAEDYLPSADSEHMDARPRVHVYGLIIAVGRMSWQLLYCRFWL